MQNNLPLISIVIPVFNREDLIQECINSCINQTYENIEIIVLDNCSEDSTFERAVELSNIYDNISVYRQKTNVGPVLNWLDVIKKANGEFVKILFSDDILYSNFIKETYSKFEPNIGFVLSSFDMGEEINKTVIQNDWPKINGEIDSNIYIESAIRKFAFCVSPGAALFRTKDVIDVFETEIPSPALNNFKSHGAGPDLLIFLKIASKYSKIFKIESALTFFRFHKNSQTIKMNKSKGGLIKSCYMQARVYFSEGYDKKMFGNSLGKALFVELFQNKKIKVLNINFLINSYTLNQRFSYIDIMIGFINAIYDAIAEVFRRINLFTRK